jgi:ElaB/YqjD/DUF883 family membrane-anchored ribosome-binding protein
MNENITDINTDRVIADLKRIVRDSELLLKDSADVLDDKGREMRQRLTEAIDAAKVTCRRLEERALEGIKVTDRVIREHPYQSIGIAAAVGILIGVLVARK